MCEISEIVCVTQKKKKKRKKKKGKLGSYIEVFSFVMIHLTTRG